MATEKPNTWVTGGGSGIKRHGEYHGDCDVSKIIER